MSARDDILRRVREALDGVSPAVAVPEAPRAPDRGDLVALFVERVEDYRAVVTRCTAADLAVFMIGRYGAELTTVITHTIERWDGKEAARRIELHVGRDLQFIRINGTIVGGLVGVVIHAFSLLVH